MSRRTGMPVSDDTIAVVDEALADEFQRLLRAAGDDDLACGDLSAGLRQMFGDEFAERGIAFGRAVLQRLFCELPVGQDRIRRCRHFLERKEIGIGRAGCKGDDARLADMPRHGADRRRLQFVDARRKCLEPGNRHDDLLG